MPKMSLVSTPLSRLLIGKQTKEDEKNVSTNFIRDGSLLYSGYLSIDNKNRIFPLMPNDAVTFQTPVIGVWFFGVHDYKIPYVWSILTRFILCRNFKESGKVPLNQKLDTFIIVNFLPNGRH